MSTWNDILYSPAYVINMDKCVRRRSATFKRLSEVGYKNINKISAVDASNNEVLIKTLNDYRLKLAVVRDHSILQFPGKIGCVLSHLQAWNRIIDGDKNICTVFEDDVLFHTRFADLAQLYYEDTPPDYDLIYIGSQLITPTTATILQAPVWCTHAMVITRAGAIKLRNWLYTNPSGGLYTLDHLIRDYMESPGSNLKWYVWNATMYPDPKANMPNGWALRNCGLVFQDADFPSFIQEHY